MKYNLGCGKDVRKGYTNVDLLEIPGVVNYDLSKTPWDFEPGSADEVLMLDFLEHFPYAKTDDILQEVWKLLKIGGEVHIQVPDANACAAALLPVSGYFCNRCGHRHYFETRSEVPDSCEKCGQTRAALEDAAVGRLFGGQDHEGNFHYTTFNKSRLERIVKLNGFDDINFLSVNENGETYLQNWNIKLTAKKKDLWDE